MSSHLVWAILLLATSALASTVPEAAVSSAVEVPNYSNPASYSQILSLSAGSFQPQSVAAASASSSFLVEGGWALRLLDTLPGSFYLSESMAYSRFSESASSVNLVGLDSRLNLSLEKLPLKWLIPFAEGGYLYNLYSQTGTPVSGGIERGTGNFVAGAGLRIWINRNSSIDSGLQGEYSAIPIFLFAKWNRIYSNGASLDLADQNVMGGLGVGL